MSNNKLLFSSIRNFINPNYKCEKIGKIKYATFINPFQPISQIMLAVPLGSANDSINGLANLTMHMLISSTKKMNTEKLYKELELKGIKLNSFAFWDDSAIIIMCLSEHIDFASQILLDCLCEPCFNDDDLTRLKRKTIAELELRKSEPDFLSHRAFSENYFFGTEYAHYKSGDIEHINNITIDDCINFYNMIKKTDILLIAGGDIDSHIIKKNIVDKINIMLLDENINRETPQVIDNLPKNQGIYIIDRDETDQTSLTFGIPTLLKTDEDFPELQLINTIYGGYFGSKLNSIIRENLGLTYGIHSYIDARQRASVLKITSDLKTEGLLTAITTIFEEFNKLKTFQISKEEIEVTQNYIYGSFLRSMDTPFQIAELLRNLLINDLETDYFDKYLEKIKNVTPEILLDKAQKYLDFSKYSIGLAGNYDLIEATLGNNFDINRFVLS